MRQILQNLKTGETVLESLPVPRNRPGNLLIQTQRSLVSLGTERMLVEFGRSSLLEKALKEPARLREILLKVRSEGVLSTYEAVDRKLKAPLPLGYCNAGIVLEVGEGVSGFKVGDRVVSNAPHAEVVSVPRNLVALVPDSVSIDEAPFAVIGAIALQGVRLSKAGFGDSVAVVGLGLIGLLAAQILKAAGCRVIGIDINQDKLELARSLGVETVSSSQSGYIERVLELTGQVGVDSVVICASTKTGTVINDCASICRKRGSIVLVGAIPLNLDRNCFYKKELSFQVSCSYGPGRYEKEYEERGIDLPISLVRWTAKRNFEAVLQAIGSGQLNVSRLITARVPFAESTEIYRTIGDNKSIATLITYSSPADIARADNRILEYPVFKKAEGQPGAAVIGAGNYAQATLLPALAKVASIKYIISADGMSSTHLAKKFKVPYTGTEYKTALNDPAIRSVYIVTRHNLHARMAIEALAAGKHVFVEKPLALNRQEVEAVSIALGKYRGSSLMVGFNRRFSPHIIKMKSLLGPNPAPLCVVATVNAGFIPRDSWVHDSAVGGGRIIGEACHLIDLLSHIVESPIIEVFMQSTGLVADRQSDQVSIILKFGNGSLGSVNYFSNGHKAYSKERIEVFAGGKTLICDNFKVLSGYGYGSGFFTTLLKTSIDKGHKEQFGRYERFVRDGGTPLIAPAEILNSTLASICAVESLVTGQPVKVDQNVLPSLEIQAPISSVGG